MRKKNFAAGAWCPICHSKLDAACRCQVHGVMRAALPFDPTVDGSASLVTADLRSGALVTQGVAEASFAEAI
ncbi:MAG: hypothetical protein NWF01_07970 [Candidatus Bathyarchaeota archaeon]|nr:hypothetical protein [Candidatus Bathyarchaeota archaeon]